MNPVIISTLATGTSEGTLIIPSHICKALGMCPTSVYEIFPEPTKLILECAGQKPRKFYSTTADLHIKEQV